MSARQSSIRCDTPEEAEADRIDVKLKRLTADLRECQHCGEFAAEVKFSPWMGRPGFIVQCECEMTTGVHGEPEDAAAQWNEIKPRTVRFLKL